MPSLLVTCYTNPDLDGFASVLAYTEFLNAKGKEAIAGISGRPREEVGYLMLRFDLHYPPPYVNPANFEQIVLVDASTLSGLSEDLDRSKVVEVIDHRAVHDGGLFPNAILQFEPVGAAATLVAEKFQQADITPSRQSAILLYGGIASNTLNFRAQVTTDRDRSAAELLKTQTDIPADLVTGMFTAKSDVSGEKLLDKLHSEFAKFQLANSRVGIVQMEMLGARELLATRVGEIAAELEKLQQHHGLDHIFVLFLELDEEINIFFAPGADTQKLLTTTLGVTFDNNIAVRTGFIMRKELVPLLKQIIEPE